MAGVSQHIAAIVRDPRNSPLTDEREAELAEILVAAREARENGASNKRIEKQAADAQEELIRRSIRLVVIIAQSYRHRIELDELVGAGNVALVRAVRVWNPDIGPLAPWVIRWVRSSMTRLVDASRTIRLPEEVAYRGAILARTRQQFELALGRPATDDEVAAAMDITEDEVKRLDSMPESLSILDAPSGGEGSVPMIDTLRSSDDPAAVVEALDMRVRLIEACKELSPAEARIIIARFDLAETGDRPTLSELGDDLGLSREMVRKMEASALAKLRHPALKVELDELAG
jgi:RNA polymerase primary sigma factor